VLFGGRKRHHPFRKRYCFYLSGLLKTVVFFYPFRISSDRNNYFGLRSKTPCKIHFEKTARFVERGETLGSNRYMDNETRDQVEKGLEKSLQTIESIFKNAS